MNTLEIQLLGTGWMLLFGVGAVWLWDCSKAWASVFGKSRGRIAIADFCYCCLLAVLFWRMLLVVNGGILRNYILLGALLGGLLYGKWLHRPGLRFWLLLFGGLYKIGSWIGKIFWRPLGALGRKIRRSLKPPEQDDAPINFSEK